MKTYDLMIIGPATRDVNIDYTGAEDHSTGGAVTFCTPAARAAGAEVFAAGGAILRTGVVDVDIPRRGTDDHQVVSFHSTLFLSASQAPGWTLGAWAFILYCFSVQIKS